jgi:hypothetical protein
MIVYILSDYDESGAEHVTATLDRKLLAGMIETNWPSSYFRYGHEKEWKSAALAKLTTLLEKSDEELLTLGMDGHDLHDGWGGAQLHVVRLVE